MDDYSRFLQAFALKKKSETPKYVEKALRFIQAKFPGPPFCFIVVELKKKKTKTSHLVRLSAKFYSLRHRY